MAIDPELADRLAFTRARVRCLRRPVVLILESNEEEFLRAYRRLCVELADVVCKIKRSARFVIEEQWFVPVNILKENLTYKLIRPILKIPGMVDRAVNKRKTYLKSLRNEA